MDSQNIRDEFKKLLERSLDDKLAELEVSDTDEQIQEIEDEILEHDPVNDKRLLLPTDNTVISYEADGTTPLSYFKDDEWLFRLKGETARVKFGLSHSIIGVNFSDPNSIPLRQFQKLLSYFHVPGINPYSYSVSPHSLEMDHHGLLNLHAYLYKHGYLLGDSDNCKSLRTISVDEIRDEVRARIKRDEGYTKVSAFARAISRWAYVSKLSALPIEMSAPFTEKEFWECGLSTDVARYVLQKEKPYQAIKFDDLQVMITRANQYVTKFSRDLIFVSNKHEEAQKRKRDADLIDTFANIRSTGVTKDIWADVVNYKFSIDDNTRNPWFSLEFMYDEDRKVVIAKKPFINELLTLVGAATFILFISTAMRSREMRVVETNALYINDEPIDLSLSVVDQVKKGKTFDLRRTVFKPAGHIKGEDHILPLSKIGAFAFAVLVDLLRTTRERSNNKYLLPAGGFDVHGSFGGSNRRHQVVSDPVTLSTVHSYLYRFFDSIEVSRYPPHSCRKTLATLLINHDPSSLELIKDLLCHKSVSMTIRYIMVLPGLAKDIKAHLVKSQRNKIVDWLSDAANGKLAGHAGDSSLDAVAANPAAFKGDMLAVTIKTLVDALTQNGNFIIIRTQAAWCMRFPSRVPFDAPCLTEKTNDDPGCEMSPNPEKCIPWACQHAGHTTQDLGRIENNLKWSRKKMTESKNNSSKSFYRDQTIYWEKVKIQLEHGRHDIVVLKIVDKALNY